MLSLTGAGLFAAGCSAGKPEKSVPAAPPAPDPETVMRNRSATASRTLLGQYDAVLARHPAAAQQLRPLREAVAEHVKAFAGASAAPPAAAAVSADRGAAVKALAAAELRTAAAHTASLDTAPAELARLLASVAAAGAVHAYLLTGGTDR
ncbi:hypothetical protein [Streptomyces beijiangensis]|uniref:hypothetical protein n=1 Tax=Streptomyces beijiangensis TaxID=163361 RepID=UPI0027DB0900|nr:hypothetical protein [Streptomyces beijiangensis]